MPWWGWLLIVLGGVVVSGLGVAWWIIRSLSPRW